MNEAGITRTVVPQVPVIAALQEAVGRGRVTNDPLELAAYVDDLSGVAIKNVPLAAVRASTVEEIQATIKVANQAGTPVTVYSAGYGLGTALPPRDAIMLDLRGMNRVLEVNEDELFVLVEPGVTFEQIAKALEGTGLVISIPDAPAQASVVANHLNFGVGSLLTERGLGLELVLGLEAVLPSGELIRTGSASRDGVGWFARFAFSPNPDLTGLFLGALGSTGVVTKLAVRVFPRPQSVNYTKFGFNTFAAGIDAMRDVARQGLVDRIVGYNWTAAPDIAPALDARVDGKPLSRADLMAIRATASHVPECYFYVGVHGHPASVAVRADLATKVIAETHGGQSMAMSDLEKERSLSVAAGRPHDLALKAVQRRKGRYQNAFHIYFAFMPISRMAELYDRWHDIGLEFGHPFAMNTKWFGQAQCASLHFLMNYFDRKDAADRSRITALCARLDEEALKLGGAGKARLSEADLLSLASEPLVRRIREAIDPNGIMQG